MNYTGHHSAADATEDSVRAALDAAFAAVFGRMPPPPPVEGGAVQPAPPVKGGMERATNSFARRRADIKVLAEQGFTGVEIAARVGMKSSNFYAFCKKHRIAFTDGRSERRRAK